MKRVEFEPAFVLHHYPYRETSVLLEAFAAGFGRFGLVARGARGARSRWRGLLQPFTPLLLSWSTGRELGSLIRAEVGGTVRLPSGRALASGFYVNELLMRLLHRHDPHPELFESYVQVVSALRDDVSQEQALRIFEKRLLDAIGYGLVLDHDVQTGAAIDQASLYWYLPDRGAYPAQGRQGDGVAVHGVTLLGLLAEELPDARSLLEAKQLMRTVLRHHTGNRPLESRKLLTPRRGDSPSAGSLR